MQNEPPDGVVATAASSRGGSQRAELDRGRGAGSDSGPARPHVHGEPLRPGRPGDEAGEQRHREMVANLRRRLAEHIGDDDVERYFDGQTRVSVRDDRLELTVASGLLAKLLDTRYGTSIRRAAGDTLGHGRPVEVLFRVDRAAFPGPPEASERTSESRRTAHAAPQVKPLASAGRFTFANFLTGKSNRLAHAAALRVADADGYVAPLFIHGSCGMGKTHLLQAALHRYQTAHPTAVVRYTTAEAFTNDFVAALKASRVEAFRRSYRKVDLIAIDDVHFFGSKEATQAELLHTLDTLGLEGARIMLASDEHPREIRKLSERLSSRFMGGVVIRVDPPDRELRERLVKHLASRRGIQIEDAAAALLVSRTERSIGTLGGFGGSVREIEGTLNQIDAVQRLLPELASTQGVVGVMLVKRALGIGDQPSSEAGVEPRVRRPVGGDVVLAEVCKSLQVEVTDVHGKGRHPRVVMARAMVAYLCRTLTTLSFPEIAAVIRRTNHSTVITAFRRLQRQMAEGEVPADGTPDRLAGRSLREIAEHIAKEVARSSS